MSDDLTIVFSAWRKKRCNHRLLFGKPCHEIRLDWQRSLSAFKPGDVFAYERWERNKFGTQNWSISVLQAGQIHDNLVAVAGVKPGAILLARREGAEACRAFFSVFDTLRSTGALATCQPSIWRVIGHRIAAGQRPQYVMKDMGFSG